MEGNDGRSAIDWRIRRGVGARRECSFLVRVDANDTQIWFRNELTDEQKADVRSFRSAR